MVAVLAAVISPALRNHDSFPLSTYPMYAGTRGRAVSIATAVGVDAAGRTHYLSLSSIADTDDPLIAESAVRRAINSGQAGALCAQIAARLDGGAAASGGAIERVEVVDERHDVVARAARHHSLLGRSVHATCAAGPEAGA
jgi:hypothetical protein